tara:strand:+ start:262 stop:1137 length:876 start_codon:yes stop_codon:yes gene_type:complete
MDVREIRKRADWEALADRVMAPLQQRWIYGETAKRLGCEVIRLCVFDRNHPIATPLAIAQVVMRTKFGIRTSLLTRGPLFLPECPQSMQRDALASLRRALPFGVHLMTAETRLRRMGLTAAPEVVELDLSKDLETLRAGMHGKWRNALKKAEGTGMKVAQLQPSLGMLMPLLRAEKDRQAQGRYRGLPPEFMLAMQEVAPKSLRLFSASDAQMLFVSHGTSASYQIGHTGAEGRALNAHNLILWQAIRRLKSEGVLRLDLGTLDRDKAPDLARFKLRSGAEARHLAPAALM